MTVKTLQVVVRQSQDVQVVLGEKRVARQRHQLIVPKIQKLEAGKRCQKSLVQTFETISRQVKGEQTPERAERGRWVDPLVAEVIVGQIQHQEAVEAVQQTGSEASEAVVLQVELLQRLAAATKGGKRKRG